MAAPTSTVSNQPTGYLNIVTGSNVDAGNNDYLFSYQSMALSNGFSIVTGTLTAMDVKVLAFNGTDSSKAVDITTDLFGAATLSSNKGYGSNVRVPYQNIIIRAARSNGVNAVYLEIFAPRR